VLRKDEQAKRWDVPEVAGARAANTGFEQGELRTYPVT
jgi:hypothetical protein